ncbi:MAG: hypothetical protein Q9224_003547 [Gallowayella concinna]
MRVPFLCIAGSIFALVAAQSKPNPFTLPPGFMINAGQPTTITWEPTTGGTVSIRLREGASSNLEEGTVIASNIDNNGKATITLPADTTRNSDYALQIVSDSDPTDVNYSAQFVVESKNTVKSVSSAPSSAASSSATAMTSTDSSTSNTDSSSMTTTGASTRTNMSTRTGSSSMTRSTGSSSATSGESTPTGESSPDATGASTTTAPSSGAMSLKAGGVLLVALVGLAIAW